MPNFINGTSGADVLNGTVANDDYLQGFQGNDTLDGGVGSNDIAGYALPEALAGTLRVVDGTGVNAGKLLVERVDGALVETVFEISRSGESFVVRGLNAAASFGTDLVSNIDDLHFFFINAANAPGRFTNVRLSPFVSTDGNAFVGGGEFADVISIRESYPNVGAGVQANANGGRGHDLIVGHAGVNNLQGGAGNDTLLGGRGDDYLQGGAGNDEIDGGRGANDFAAFNLPESVVGTLRLVEGTGADAGKLLVQLVNGGDAQTVFQVVLEGDQATVTGVGIAADQGVDVVTNVDQLHFTPFGPFDQSRFVSIRLDIEVQAISGGRGAAFGNFLGDVIDLNTLHPSATAATILNADGRNGDDVIVGHEGKSEFLSGGAGDDTILGGGGDDYMPGGEGNDSLDGGTGVDDIAGFRLPPNLTGTLRAVDGTGADAGKIFIERLVGGVFVETLWVVSRSGEAITVTGLGSAAAYGTDTVVNVDQLHFGFDNEPFDPARFVSLSLRPFVNPVNGTNAFVGGGIGDDALNLPDLYPGVGADVNLNANGNQGDDLIVGHLGNNDLQGGLGADTLLGGAGNDGLTGGGGNDILDGGSGFADSAQWRLPVGTPGTFRVVEGVGVDAGKLIVERVDGATVERLFEVTLSGSTATVVGVNSATSFGTDVASNVDQLQFFVPNNPFVPAQFTSILLSPVVNAPNNGIGFVTGSALSDQLVLGTLYPADLRIDASGNRGDDLIIGHAGLNFITGGVGNDFLFGSGGADTLFGGAGNDLAEGGDGDDFIVGELGDDTLTGNAGDDLLRGFEGVDVYAGGDGFDRISFYALLATQGVVADLALGTVSNDGYGNAEIFSSIEGLGGGTRFADVFRGDDGENFLAVETGDTAEGRGGDDTIQISAAPALADGGDGVDFAQFFVSRLVDADGNGVAEVEESPLGVIVDLSAQAVLDDGFGESGVIRNIEGLGGTASADSLTGDGEVNELLGLGGHDTLAGLGAADSLAGGSGDDSLDGGLDGDDLAGEDGDDTLEGGAGDDTLNGGAGRDAASYAGAAAAVSVSLALSGLQDTQAEGSDELIGIEDLIGSGFNDVLAGEGGDNRLFGGGGNDSLTGDGGADTLNGGAGADTLDGGAGRDAAAYDGAASGVTVSLAVSGAQATGGAGTDTLAGIEDLIGSGNADQLTGDGGANALSGGAGADTLIGGLGNDTLNGGADVDLVSYATRGGRVTANLLTGLVTIQGGEVDAVSDVENLVTGSGADTLIGDSAANALNGAGGDDTIEGGEGDDQLEGGAGVDAASYAGAVAGVNVSVNGAGQATGGAGTDSLSGFENLTGSGFGDTLRGDGGANSLFGGAGDDSLNGGLGADTIGGGTGSDTAVYNGNGLSGAVQVDLGLSGAQNTGAGGLDLLLGIENLVGGGGDDVLSGESGANDLRGGNGDDLLDGRNGNDDLAGGGGADTLNGGDGGDKLAGDEGNDLLVGGLGADQMNGGTGVDVFVYLNAADSGVTKSSRDALRGFAVGQDVIDVSAIDAISGGSDDAFTLASTFSGAGQLVLKVSRGDTLIEGHADADGVADFAVLVIGVTGLTIGDFVL